jgi:hypothetical protein
MRSGLTTSTAQFSRHAEQASEERQSTPGQLLLSRDKEKRAQNYMTLANGPNNYSNEKQERL